MDWRTDSPCRPAVFVNERGEAAGREAAEPGRCGSTDRAGPQGFRSSFQRLACREVRTIPSPHRTDFAPRAWPLPVERVSLHGGGFLRVSSRPARQRSKALPRFQPPFLKPLHGPVLR